MPALYEEIKKHSIEVLARVYDVNDTTYLETMLNNWEKSKKWFLEKFNGPTVRIAEDITTEVGEEEKRQLINKCASKIKNYLAECKEAPPSTVRYDIYDFIVGLTSYEFFNNILTENRMHCAKGVKAAKSIKYFFPSNPSEVEKGHILKIQMIMSEFQQKNKVHGDLYLSVHPVDFLTISTNNHKWTSCHALYHAYSAGNIAYIQDQATCIAYLVSKGNEHVQINKYPELGRWNDKTWRMLIFMNEDLHLAAAGRHYPFEVMELEEKAMVELVPSYESNWGRLSSTPRLRKAGFFDRLVSAYEADSDHHYYRYLNHDERQVSIMGGELISLKDIIILNDQRRSEEPRFYCDIIDSTAYIPRFYYNYNWYVNREDVEPIRIGGLGCGCLTCEADANCESYALPYCKDCFDDGIKTSARTHWWTCCGCGYQEHYSIAEPQYDEEDRAFCRDCYDNREDEEF